MMRERCHTAVSTTPYPRKLAPCRGAGWRLVHSVQCTEPKTVSPRGSVRVIGVGKKDGFRILQFRRGFPGPKPVSDCKARLPLQNWFGPSSLQEYKECKSGNNSIPPNHE